MPVVRGRYWHFSACGWRVRGVRQRRTPPRLRPPPWRRSASPHQTHDAGNDSPCTVAAPTLMCAWWAWRAAFAAHATRRRLSVGGEGTKQRDPTSTNWSGGCPGVGGGRRRPRSGGRRRTGKRAGGARAGMARTGGTDGRTDDRRGRRAEPGRRGGGEWRGACGKRGGLGAVDRSWGTGVGQLALAMASRRVGTARPTPPTHPPRSPGRAPPGLPRV